MLFLQIKSSIILESSYMVIIVWFDENKMYINPFEKRIKLLE